MFRQLVILFRSANGDVQNSTREALLRLNVCFSHLYYIMLISIIM